MKYILKISSFGVILVYGFLLAGCEGPPKDLSIADKKRLDSLYRDELKVIRGEMDSLCRVQKDSITQAAIDSLLEENIREITEQLERIKNNLQEK